MTLTFTLARCGILAFLASLHPRVRRDSVVFFLAHRLEAETAYLELRPLALMSLVPGGNSRMYFEATRPPPRTGKAG